MFEANFKLYKEIRKVDKENYETPIESFATDFYRDLIACKLKEKEARILDLGCFKGILVEKLNEYKTYGMDVTPDGFMKPGKYLVGAGEDLPIKTNSLDCVAMTEVAEHLSEPQKVFQEIHRVLKPEGYFLITHPNKYNLLDQLIEYFKENRLVRKLLRRPLYEGVQHVQGFCYDDTINNLKPYNFSLDSCHAFTFSFYRIFSVFVYGRFKCDFLFKLIKKIIQLEYWLIKKLGEKGLSLTGNCVLLFKVSNP